MINKVGDKAEWRLREDWQGQQYRVNKMSGRVMAFHQPKSTPSKCSVATCGCESWAMHKNDRKRVDAFEMWC